MNASPSGEVLPSTNRIVSYPNSFSTPMTRTTDPLESQQRIIFSALDDSFTVADSYSLDTVRSSDSPMFVEAKAPRILNKVDGTEYEMDIQSLAGGEAMYTVNTQELDESLVDISAPVFYVEHDVEEVNVPLFAGMERESSMLAVTVGETQGISYLEDGHLVLDFTATDDSLVPFDMVLISNGEVYKNFSTQFFFDTETGRFTNGQLVFWDLMAEDLSEDAHFVVSSVYERACLDMFTLSK